MKKACSICKQSKEELVDYAILDEALKDICNNKLQGLSKQNNIVICNKCLDDLRVDYIKFILQLNKDELSKTEEEVVDRYKANELISQNTELQYQKSLSYADKIADAAARFGGSWYFIILSCAIIGSWTLINNALSTKAFDPYPYILLNLVLSTIAALQAPIILMNQNRQAIKDRMNIENDYKTNLKAELAVQFIHAKLDQLMKNQWERLLKVQQMQIELMERLNSKQSH